MKGGQKFGVEVRNSSVDRFKSFYLAKRFSVSKLCPACKYKCTEICKKKVNYRVKCQIYDPSGGGKNVLVGR